MSERLQAHEREGLPPGAIPFKPCNCRRCKGYRHASAQHNRRAPFRLRTKKVGERIDYKLTVNDWVRLYI